MLVTDSLFVSSILAIEISDDFGRVVFLFIFIAFSFLKWVFEQWKKKGDQSDIGGYQEDYEVYETDPEIYEQPAEVEYEFEEAIEAEKTADQWNDEDAYAQEEINPFELEQALDIYVNVEEETGSPSSIETNPVENKKEFKNLPRSENQKRRNDILERLRDKDSIRTAWVVSEVLGKSKGRK